MKVLILAGPDKIEKAEEIKSLCSFSGTELSIYSKIEYSRTGLSSCLEISNLLIIIWDELSIFNTEIIFSMGYCVGINKNIILFGNKDNTIPQCKGKAVIISNFIDLKVYFRSEAVKYNKLKAMAASKSSILELGLELSTGDLVEVVSKGESKALKQYLGAGFSIDSCDKNGVSILNIAIRQGHNDIAALLIDKGASINIISADRANTPLMDAAAEAEIDILGVLIKAGADLNLKSKSGQTALILSIGRKAEDTAIKLIESGADIHIKDDLGMSAKKYAELFKLNKVLSIIKRMNEYP
jgi:uncharacterized protein